MSSDTEQLNKDNSEMFKLLTDVSKQNSDSITKQNESITKLGEGQDSIVKTLGIINETLKSVSASDNNNPTGPGIGMEQKPKVESPTDVGDKTKVPNAYAPGEYGSTGRGVNEPANDKGGLSMEAKKTEDKPEEEVKEEPKKEEKTEEPKKEEKTEEPKKEEKTEEPKKEEKYKSYNYKDNEH